MPRSAASIQAEIDRLETFLAADDTTVESGGVDGSNLRRYSRDQLASRLDLLYRQLDRVNGTSPMFTRGHVRGLH